MKFAKHQLRWGVLILVLCSWMSLGVLSDCDTEIADQVLTGVGGATADLASVLIVALFDAIKPEEQTPVTTSSIDPGLHLAWLS